MTTADMKRLTRRHGWAIAVAVCALAVASAVVGAQQAPMRVIASNGVRTFVEALVKDFERTSGRTLSLTYGTSSGLVKDISAGAPVDVAIATAGSIDELTAAGKLAKASRTVIGRSPVGIGVKQGARRPAIATSAEIRQALMDAKGVTYAGDGASRPHIEAMFAKLGIADAMKAKTILEQGSNRAIARVTAGDAELLITLVSEILPAPGMELVGPLPKEFTSEVSFAAAVGANPADAKVAKAFVAFLASPAATATLRQKGLER